MLGAFHVGAVGTVAGTFISAFLLSAVIPYVAEIAAMLTGSYIGGGANFVAMTNAPTAAVTAITDVANNA